MRRAIRPTPFASYPTTYPRAAAPFGKRNGSASWETERISLAQARDLVEAARLALGVEGVLTLLGDHLDHWIAGDERRLDDKYLEGLAQAVEQALCNIEKVHKALDRSWEANEQLVRLRP